MPEFRGRYDTAAVSHQISQPPFAELVHRGRRRARRDRTVRLAGVAVAVALVATPLLTLPGDTGPNPPADSPIPDEQYPPHTEFLYPGFGIVVWDVREQFDIREPAATTCTRWLAVTEDGGSTWSELRELPRFPGQDRVEAESYCLLSRVVPIAPDTLVMPVNNTRTVHAYLSAGVDEPTAGFISYNAGRTWREHEPRIRTANTVPDEVFPELRCKARAYREDLSNDGSGWCRDDQVTWYDPETGDQMVLRNNPPFLQGDTDISASGLTVGADRSIWVQGRDSDGNFHLSVSQDRGRTWDDATPERVTDVADNPIDQVAAHDGETAYFFSEPGIDGAPPTPIYRTTDAGETWHPLPVEHPFSQLLTMWAAWDGKLVVSGHVGDQFRDTASGTVATYVSDDGMGSFEVPKYIELPSHAQPILGGFLSDGDPPAVSEDGMTWQEFDLPEPPPS